MKRSRSVKSVQMRVGARIRRLRKARGWSMERLAELSDLSGNYVGQVERGAGNPTLDVLAAIAKALNVPLAGLLVDESSGEFIRILKKADVAMLKRSKAVIEELLIES